MHSARTQSIFFSFSRVRVTYDSIREMEWENRMRPHISRCIFLCFVAAVERMYLRSALFVIVLRFIVRLLSSNRSASLCVHVAITCMQSIRLPGHHTRTHTQLGCVCASAHITRWHIQTHIHTWDMRYMLTIWHFCQSHQSPKSLLNYQYANLSHIYSCRSQFDNVKVRCERCGYCVDEHRARTQRPQFDIHFVNTIWTRTFNANGVCVFFLRARFATNINYVMQRKQKYDNLANVTRILRCVVI